MNIGTNTHRRHALCNLTINVMSSDICHGPSRQAQTTSNALRVATSPSRQAQTTCSALRVAIGPSRQAQTTNNALRVAIGPSRHKLPAVHCEWPQAPAGRRKLPAMHCEWPRAPAGRRKLPSTLVTDTTSSCLSCTAHTKGVYWLGWAGPWPCYLHMQSGAPLSSPSHQ